MVSVVELQKNIDRFARIQATHAPTPIEPLDNLGHVLGAQLSVKRDDCTGFAFGGNKVRQLEFYLGDALNCGADTVLITGAVQSNFVRTTAAMAARFNLKCHIQLEERVKNNSPQYRENGNVLLDKLLGCVIHRFSEGEDESAADASLESIASDLKSKGARPYVIHLSAAHPPIGALGYVVAALELAAQLPLIDPIDEIVIPSGSALTHTGLLYGLRAIGLNIPVCGICVRRDTTLQTQRVKNRLEDINKMIDLSVEFESDDIKLYDGVLAPGYGQLNDHTLTAIEKAARLEGLLLDPAYSGKAMAGLMQLCDKSRSDSLSGKHVLFWHTGGGPAIFAYADQLVK